VDRALREGRLIDAERVCASVLEGDPDDWDASRLLAIVLARKGEFAKSIEAFQKCLNTRPSSVECLNWLSIIRRRQGQAVLAEAASLAAVQIDPNNADSLNNLGLAYLAANKLELAAQTLWKAVECSPRDAQFRHNLGITLQSQGRDTEAAECFRVAITLSDRSIPSYLSLGGIMLGHGNPTAAQQCALAVLKQLPTSIPAHLLAARALTNLDRGEESEWHLREVIRLDPKNSIAYGMLGFRLQFSGKFEEANSAFQKSLEYNPIQGISHWGLRLGKKTKAGDAQELDRLSDLARSESMPTSERSFLHYAIGKGWADLNEFEKAIRQYDEANDCGYQTHLAKKPFDPARYGAAFELTMGLFTREFIARHAELSNSSIKPIFIVGMMRSGTTLMEQILSSHPQVTAGGELQFWLERAPKVVDVARRLVEPMRARKLAEDYLDLLAKISPKGRVTDKMPQNIQVVGLIKILFPNAKIINMNRNPVDNCLSIYFTPYEFPPEFAHVRENIVFAYRRNQEITEHWRKVLPHGDYFDVQYEDLVDHSEATIRAVLAYCDLEWDDRCLRHDDNKRVVNTPSVWQVRQPIYRTSKEQWRNYEPYLGVFSELIQ